VHKSLIPGVIADVITPFAKDGQIDLDALQKEVKVLDASAVDGVCIGGMLSGMEGTLAEELGVLCGAVKKGTSKPIFAMLFPDTTLEGVEMIRAVEDAGASAVLVAQPHYLSLPSEEGLTEMYADLRKVTRGPLLLADCFVGGIIGVATTKAIVGKKLVDGVYQSADIHVLVDLLYTKLGVPVYSGVEDLHYIAYALGARGVISDLASLFPKEASEVYRSYRDGKQAEARTHHERLVRLWRSLGRVAEGEGRVRLALEAQGRKVGSAPSPYNKVPAHAAEEVRKALQHEGFAKA